MKNRKKTRLPKRADSALNLSLDIPVILTPLDFQIKKISQCLGLTEVSQEFTHAATPEEKVYL